MNTSLLVHAATWRDMAPHIETLSRLAHGRRCIAEFGVRTGVSTWALLDGMALDGELWSWDNAYDPDRMPVEVTQDSRWTITVGDSAQAHADIRPDLVFVDTSHEYHHTLAELAVADAWKAPVIALHDWNLPDVRDAVKGFCERSTYRIAGIEPSEWGFVWLYRS